MKVPVDEFDGKVVYGEKRKAVGKAINGKLGKCSVTIFVLYVTGSTYQSHVSQMAPAVQELALLEAKTQIHFLKQMSNYVR